MDIALIKTALIKVVLATVVLINGTDELTVVNLPATTMLKGIII
jgi:hypothetical protein